MIAIIDFEIGNLAAIANMLRRLGAECSITSDPELVGRADKLILPGNGAYDACMRNLRSTGLIPLLEQRVLRERVPMLGICVGAQMLGTCSEEGNEPGLGWLDLTVKRFSDRPEFRVPHMGWNQTRTVTPHPLIGALPPDARFYFVHSYFLQPSDPNEILLSAEYGIEFAAAVGRGNLVGVQFHPEKSHRFGKALLGNFAQAVT
jgi:glutamine amidotransferase